ncbi:fibronectin type III domain-containing protein [Natrinema sp. DC36]|uniref:fibronectin type III domain-containing protein n=1 Tax=Natrinema sp. DC36 TaxID=2878680 RepID=UPI001CF02A4B|nr:fibronectin type III domain-containing protein [Natrinema sp. DC36]
MPTTFTTDVPDIDSLSLDASVAEEITAAWNADLNNGEYRLELRDDDPSGDHPPYELETTVPFDGTLEHVTQNILGGEQYSVRVRAQTQFVTGEWMAAEELTKLLASDAIEFTDVGQVSLTAGWTINNDFRGSHQVYRRRTDYGVSTNFSDDAELIGTVASDDSDFVDDTVGPDREYEYRVRTLTQWQYADSSVSDPVVTEALEIGRSPVPARGWYVEVDHPSGTTFTPQVLDDAQLEPRLKALPRAQIPVPRSETWLSEALEDAPMRVWKDGERQPIDEIEDVDIQADRTVLVGTGGTELEQTVDRDVVAEPAHEVAADLVGDETGYVVNVDAPPVEESEAVAQDPATASEWTDVTEHSDLSEIPVGIDNSADAPVTQRSNILLRTGGQQWAGIGGTGTSVFDDSAFASGTGIGLQDQGDYVRWTFSLESTIAEENLRFALRAESDSDVPPLTATITDTDADQTVGSVSLWSNSSSLSLQWYSHESFEDGATIFASSSASEWDAGDLPAGNYELRLEAGTTYGDQGELRVDLLSVHDDRYQYDFGDSVDASGGIDGPAPYPHLVETRLDQYQAVLSVYGGELAIDANDTGGEQFIEISNDGIDWLRADNSSTVSGEFADLGGSIMVRLGFSRHGDDGEGAVPRYGTEPTQINSLTLTAWLNDTPLVIGRNLKGDLSEVLTTQIADNVDALWEARQDGDQTTFEWAQAGTRSSDRDADVVDYSVTKHNRRYLKATVEGGRSTVSDEAVTASYGSPVALEEGRVIAGSERVRSAETGERYRTGLDYELRPGAGELDIREAGAIADGEALLVDYEHNVIGEWEHSDYDGDTRTHLEETIPNATTPRACTRAAKVLVDELSVPRWEADVSIPPGDAIDGLLEALDLEAVPGDALAVYENDVTPEGQQLRLGNRQQVSETVRRIQSQLAATSDRV